MEHKGKALAKADGYSAVSIAFAASPLGFTLTVPEKGKKGQTTALALTAPLGVRDLIALTLQTFAEPAALDDARRFPVVVTSGGPSSSLHLGALGSISTPKVDGGGTSPASSQTSEQAALADVEPASAKAKRSNLAGRALSFSRSSKKK